MPFPAVIEDAKPKSASMVREAPVGRLSVVQLKRLSVVKEGQKDESENKDT
jgi:hypothetical protein